MNAAYARTVQLLLEIAPAVFETSAFAMKGGTALNLFLQDMPRLSVDIDVVFVPHELPRREALARIGEELAAAQVRIRKLGYGAILRQSKEGADAKMFVSGGGAEIKVEVNFVSRGTVLPLERRALVPAAQRMFSMNLEVPLLAPPELYGSKLVAALDRQHPRDLFDVKLMLAGGGWDDVLLDCFVVYLAGHNRPMHEVLFPTEKPIEAVFSNDFVGMTSTPIDLDELLTTRQRLIDELPKALHARHRNFLLSVARAEPDWRLLPHAHLERLPALQWKLQNLAALRRNAGKFKHQHDVLAERLVEKDGK